MDWLKFDADFINDPKMRRYFSKAERSDWVSLLCLASKSKERGVILLPDEEIAYALELSDEDWISLCDRFIERRMVYRRQDGALVLTNFSKHQTGKPSDSPEAVTARKRAQRLRNKEQKEQVSRPVTRDSVTCHAEETRQEEKRLDIEEIRDRQTDRPREAQTNVVHTSGRSVGPETLEKQIGFRLPDGREANWIRSYLARMPSDIPKIRDRLQEATHVKFPVLYAYATLQEWKRRDDCGEPREQKPQKPAFVNGSARTRLTPNEERYAAEEAKILAEYEAMSQMLETRQ